MLMAKKLSQKLQWSILVLLGLLITLFLYFNQVPAAFLLGPMLAGIIAGLNRFDISIPKSMFNLSQGVLGCLTAKAITIDVLFDLFSYWSLALVITVSTICISIFISLFIVRFSRLSGSTAIWGIMPGGASAMVGICGDYGADPRLVALIQYLRVIFVIFMLAVFSHFFTLETMTNNASSATWFAESKINLLYTLLISVVGVTIAKLIRFPSGRILFPMIIGTFLQINGFVQLETPLWLLLLCFGAIGLSVGVRFNIDVIKLAFKTLPIILVAVFIMLIFCYGQAILLHYYLGFDYLTCFLATSPGGLETSVIIALDTQSNLSVILPLQILRLFSVLVFGPPIARYLSIKFG